MRRRFAVLTAFFAVLSACAQQGEKHVINDGPISASSTVSESTTSSTLANQHPTSIVAGNKTTTTTVKPLCANDSDKSSITVFAASSMINVFTDVKEKYLQMHPCTTDIVFSYGSSGTLATQIVNGAPADVFVSASTATMTTVQDANVLKSLATVFAKNIAEIMIYPKSKFMGTIGTIEDLLDARSPGIKVGVCVASAPCGLLANTVLSNARTSFSNSSLTRANIADSESPSVEDLVMKIELGELDAGIVYHSDCQFAIPGSKATCAEIPASINSTNSYLVGALSLKKNTTDFIAYMNSYDFQHYAQWKYGFLAP